MNHTLSTILLVLVTLAGYSAAAHVHDDDCEDHGDSCPLCLLANNASSPIPAPTHDLPVEYFIPFRHIVSGDSNLSVRNDCFIPSPRAPPPG